MTQLETAVSKKVGLRLFILLSIATIFDACVAQYSRIVKVYRENENITIRCQTYYNMEANPIQNQVAWFHFDAATHESFSIKDELEPVLNITVTKVTEGVYTCVVYDMEDVIAMEDTVVDLTIVNFSTLYKENLIVAIIVSTSFVLVVLLAWLIWSYRWPRPSKDDDETKNATEKLQEFQKNLTRKSRVSDFDLAEQAMRMKVQKGRSKNPVLPMPSQMVRTDFNNPVFIGDDGTIAEIPSDGMLCRTCDSDNLAQASDANIQRANSGTVPTAQLLASSSAAPDPASFNRRRLSGFISIEMTNNLETCHEASSCGSDNENGKHSVLAKQLSKLDNSDEVSDTASYYEF